MDLAACSLQLTLAVLTPVSRSVPSREELLSMWIRLSSWPHSIVYFSTEVSVNMLVRSLARYSSSLVYGRVALVLFSRAADGEENISNGNVSLDKVVYRPRKAFGRVLYGIILLLLEAQ